MHLLHTLDPVEVAKAVSMHIRRHQCMAAIRDLGGTYHLYGGASCTEALLEGLEDHPGATRHGEYEYLDPATINAMRAAGLAKDPVAAAIRNMGKADPKKITLP